MDRKASGLPRGFLFALTLGTLTAAPAIAQLGVAERAGEALDNAGRNIRRGVETAIERGRAPIVDRQLLTRVFGRIQWDKTLAGSTLDLEVRDEGTVFLRGAVATPEAKDRAVLLAKDTIGVTQVVDELTILPPARVIPSDGAASSARSATIRIRPGRASTPAPAGTTVVTEPAAPAASVKPAPAIPLSPPSDGVIITP